MNKFKITTRDYFWIIVILVSIIITVSGVRLSANREIINIFSFMASGISITLAFVAIVMSIKQDLNSNILNSETKAMISDLSEKINKIDFTLSNLDVKTINETIKQSFDEVEVDIKESIKTISNDGKVDPEQVQIMIDDKLNRVRRFLVDGISNYYSDNIETNKILCNEDVYESFKNKYSHLYNSFNGVQSRVPKRSDLLSKENNYDSDKKDN